MQKMIIMKAAGPRSKDLKGLEYNSFKVSKNEAN